VVVESYDGVLESTTASAAARALGLPLAELAERTDCDLTLLDWDDWRAYEAHPDAFTRWIPFPSTRPLAEPDTRRARFRAARVRNLSVAPTDPETGRPLAKGLSLRTHGLLAESDPLFFASYLLDAQLEALHRERPIDAVLLPMWGGLGYVPQLSAATGAGLKGVRFAVLVTDTSRNRQEANGEGLWTRPAITRRQMEDLSLALADLAICFGPRSERIASDGAPDAPRVTAPRRVEAAVVRAIEAAAQARPAVAPAALVLAEPLQPASGALVALDAAKRLRDRQAALPGPIFAPGGDMVFAPQKPRDFRGYWSGRGWVREMVDAGLWAWSEPPAAAGLVALHPTLFDHLPDIWTDLAEGRLPILSPAAAEGLAPGAELPRGVLLAGEPTPDGLAEAIERTAALSPADREALRQETCKAVVAGLTGSEPLRRLDETAAALDRLLRRPGPRPSLSQAARLLLDRRVPPAQIPALAPPTTDSDPQAPELTVAVMCYEMGDLLVETIHSVWSSDRAPDELILVDDGSHGEATLAAIRRLEEEAAGRGLPLQVIRQRNTGLAGARNTALAHARGRFISFLDGDDLIEPGFYGLALDVLRRNPGLGGVAAWAVTFGEGVPDGFWNAPQAELPLLLVENTLFVPIMTPTALLRELGGYDVRQRYNYEDWEIGVRLLAAGRPIVTIPRYLQRYRVRADSLLRTMSDVQNQVMRELFMQHHRQTVERFGPEVAMQLENQLMKTKARCAELERRLKASGGSTSSRDLLSLVARRARNRVFARLRR